MFDGYLSLGGTEIINSERTATYVRHLIPTLNLRSSCCECDTLADYLGDAPYASPLQDEPGWYSPFRTESADFLGLVPLAMEGFDDSTHSVSITEVTGDGSVSGRPRRASRDVRVRALMVATTEKGLDLGMSWLRDALVGSGCAEGDCSGDDLCYLAACPEPCDDPLTTEILNLDTRYMTSAAVTAEAANWQSSTGTVTASGLGSIRALRVTSMTGPSEVSRVIDGLTPGATYRVTLTILAAPDTSSATYVDLDVAGSAAKITSPRVYGWTGAPDTSGASLEFQATSDTHRVVIVPRGIAASATEPPAALWLTSLTVVRTPALSLLSAGAVNHANPESVAAWSPVMPGSGYTANWSTSWGGFTFTAVGAQSPAVQTLGTSRTLQDLIPGQRYLIRLGARLIRSGTTTPSAQTLSVRTAGGSWVNVSAPGWTGSSQGDTAWVTYPFIATGSTTTLTVANAEAGTMASGATYGVEVSYLRVEKDPSGVAIEPIKDPSRPMRHLRNVVTTSGPAVTEVFPAREAHLQVVEWTMNAGAPRPAGDPITVTQSLGMGSVVIPEGECYNGQPVVTNLVPNPSFETNATGWITVSSNWSAVTRVSSPSLASAGTYIGQVTSTATSNGVTIAYTVSGLIPGAAYTFSAVMGSSLSGVLTTLRATGTTPMLWSGVTTGGPLPLGTAGARRSLQFHVPPSHTGSVDLQLSFNQLAMPTGTQMWFDAVMLTPTAYVTQYVDGSIPGGSWSGTAHASTSSWRSPVAATVFDPSCPPPPDPPRPPIVVNDCVPESDRWLRYTVGIPAQVTQQGTSAFPAVTLTTGSTAARGVRVRLYPNPFSLPPGQIDPCGYCGEFLLSYLPPNASLTVDASLRDATVSVSGQSQTAMQLLYGADGGPMTWPEMDCGVEYLLAVDLDADTPPLIGLELNVIPAF